MSTEALPGFTWDDAVRRRQRGINWQDEILHLASGLSGALWFTPWILVLLPGAYMLSSGQVAAFIILHVMVALLISRYLAWRRVEPLTERIVFMISVALALAITFLVALPLSGIGGLAPLFANGHLFFPPPLLTAILVTGLWINAQQTATAVITPARAAVSLRVGILGLIGAALLPDVHVQQITLSLLLPFFSISLLAASLARAASLYVTREVQRSPFGLSWILLVAAIGTGFSLIGLSIALLMGGVQLDSLLGLVVGPIKALLALVVSLLLPIAQLLAGIIQGAIENPKVGIAQALTSSSRLLTSLTGKTRPPSLLELQLTNILLVLLIAIVIIAVLVALIVSLNRANRQNGAAGETHETMDSNALLSGLGANLQAQLNLLRQRLSDLNPFGAGEVVTIRRLYARLCVLGADQGYPRAESQTPTEYRSDLYKAFPGYQPTIDELTRAYVAVRYGERPDDPAAVARARESLDLLAVEVKKTTQ